VSLLILLAVIIALYTQRHRIRQSRLLTTSIRYASIAALLLPELLLNLWYVSEKTWDVRYTLPLELCSITLVLSVVMLLNRSFLLYQILFFAGMGGALQAIITPNLFYAFPHFRFFHFFIVHSFIIVAVLYMTWIERYRPTFKSIGLTMIFLNAALVVVGGLDVWLDANYMFLRHKPETASVMDVLGPYPYYLISLELFAAAVFILMYVPFMVAGKRRGVSEPQ
jgi:hypothetical integral membrane protein (TIGR02206 family)